jgi:hypothetical protein
LRFALPAVAPTIGAPIAGLAAGAFMMKTRRAAALLFLAACTDRGTIPVGGRCTIDESCTTGLCLRETKTESGQAWRGGYCSGLCETTPCPDAQCVAFADGHKYCTSECSDNGDCRSGYVCSKAVSACLPDCGLGWSCGSALSCDQGTGECVTPDSVQPTVPLVETRTATATGTTQSITSTMTDSRTDTAAGTGSGAGPGSGFHGGTSTGRGMFASPASPLVPRALSAATTSTGTSWGTGIGISTAIESR